VSAVDTKDFESWKINCETLKFKSKSCNGKNDALEQQLLLVGNTKDAVKRDTVKVKPGCAECLVLGNSIVKNVGAGKINMRVECFPGIRANQLRGVMETEILDM
jgi:hypothetical protein